MLKIAWMLGSTKTNIFSDERFLIFSHAVQTTKYGLKGRRKSAKTMFIKKDFRHDATDSNLVCNLMNVHSLHIREEEEARNVLEDCHPRMAVSKPS